MNWEQVEGKWEQYKGKAKERWGKFTDDDIDMIDGRRQQLVGKIQERYGLAKEAAEKQANEFMNSLKSGREEEVSEHDREAGRERGKARRAGQH